MANIGGPKDFWNILKGVSINAIAQEADRPLEIALVGSEEACRAVQAELGTHSVKNYRGFTTEDGFPQKPGFYQFVIALNHDTLDAPGGIPLYATQLLGGWEATLERILEDRPDLHLALARRFPLFRKAVVNRIIQQTAMANAQFSLLTGVTSAFPILSVLLPVNALSDIVVLTKNQMMMTLRIAAAYGLPIDYQSRMKEIVPLIGNAVGWRSIAREVTGMIPFVGFAAKASIAYAGTVTLGKSVAVYYETGQSLTSQQAKRLYQDAYAQSRDRVKGLIGSLRKRKSGTKIEGNTSSERTLALPAPVEELELLEGESSPKEGNRLITGESAG